MKFKVKHPEDFRPGDYMSFQGNLFVWRRIARWIKHKVFRIKPHWPVVFTVTEVDHVNGIVKLR